MWRWGHIGIVLFVITLNPHNVLCPPTRSPNPILLLSDQSIIAIYSDTPALIRVLNVIYMQGCYIGPVPKLVKSLWLDSQAGTALLIKLWFSVVSLLQTNTAGSLWTYSWYCRLMIWHGAVCKNHSGSIIWGLKGWRAGWLLVRVEMERVK